MDIGVLRRLHAETWELYKLIQQDKQLLEKEENEEVKFLLRKEISIATLVNELITERIKGILKDNDIEHISFNNETTKGTEPIILREYISKLDERTSKLSALIQTLENNEDLSTHTKSPLVVELWLQKGLLSIMTQRFNVTEKVNKEQEELKKSYHVHEKKNKHYDVPYTKQR